MSERAPLAIDLFCGLGGWAEGLLSEGWHVIGFDIERHNYGTGAYPGQLVLQDVLTLRGWQFRSASLIVASPPCQAYSYRAMPWSRAKALPPPDNALFDACFRIQREASEAAGHHIPLIVENVRGAVKWVSEPVKWHFGSYYLWGDVPALMPITLATRMKSQISCSPRMFANRTAATPQEAHALHYRMPLTNQRESEGVKVVGVNFSDRSSPGFNVRAAQLYREGVKNGGDWLGSGADCSLQRRFSGTKQPGISGQRSNGKGDKWFQDGAARHGSKSNSRKAASATIAKIPFALAQHIARVFKRVGEHEFYQLNSVRKGGRGSPEPFVGVRR